MMKKMKWESVNITSINQLAVMHQFNLRYLDYSNYIVSVSAHRIKVLQPQDKKPTSQLNYRPILTTSFKRRLPTTLPCADVHPSPHMSRDRLTPVQYPHPPTSYSAHLAVVMWGYPCLVTHMEHGACLEGLRLNAGSWRKINPIHIGHCNSTLTLHVHLNCSAHFFYMLCCAHARASPWFSHPFGLPAHA